jgi:hypothetical protein
MAVMRSVLLITLTLVLALGAWTTAWAEDGFYVIPVMKGKYAPVPKTGQTTPYDQNIPPKDDGALQKGVAWPTPRFTDNNNGTVTDNLTKLIWMKNANAFSTKTWADALIAAKNLQSGSIPNLNDGSNAGDWRLPNRKELESLIDCGFYNPALPNTLGTGQWREGNPFQGVQSAPYWSSNTLVNNPIGAWYVNFVGGGVENNNKGYSWYVWCVRGGP